MTLLIEDLVSRGHRYHDLVDVYPVALVINFHRAARLNRRILVADMAVGVSLGIRDAFAKEGKLVHNWISALNEPRSDSEPAAPPRDTLPLWTKHLPVIRRKRHG